MITEAELAKLFNIDEIDRTIEQDSSKIESLIKKRDELQKDIDELKYMQQSLYQLKANAEYLLLKSKLETENGNN